MITYNHEPYIAQAIEGVLMQKTAFPIELIIGEDCSTDRTRDIVLNYQRNYPEIIRVITSDKNIGMRNNGLRTSKACRGRYMAFCEGDDFWLHPLKLQKQVDLMEANGLALCVHSADYLNPDNQIETKHPLPSSSIVSPEEIIKKSGGFFATGSYVFRKESILPLPDWFFSVTPVGDYYLTILAANNGPVYFLKESMCVYRVISLGSWSSQYKSMEWHDKFYYRHIQSLTEFNKMTGKKYDKAITFKMKQLLADNIRAYAKFDKIKALRLFILNFFKIDFMNKIVILNRIFFR
jgi:glycosyltransferase involved in cell wall biosynthesis